MSNHRVICVTPNAALDRILVVPDFEIGRISRIQHPLNTAGGKGLNVVRALKTLGGQPIAMGLLGGHVGKFVADLVDEEGFESHWTWFDGQTRICTIIVPANGQSTVINESGRITESDWANLVTDIVQQSENASTVCLSGSLPLGAPADGIQQLIKLLNAKQKQIWVDTSGETLQKAIEAKPTAIKVNGDEIGAIFNQQVYTPASVVKIAQALLETGIEYIVVTLGKMGGVLIHNDGAYYVQAPPIQVVNPVASGDSFLAGVVKALIDDKDLGVALQYGVAAGTANALFEGGANFTYNSFTEILNQTIIENL